MNLKLVCEKLKNGLVSFSYNFEIVHKNMILGLWKNVLEIYRWGVYLSKKSYWC